MQLLHFDEVIEAFPVISGWLKIVVNSKKWIFCTQQCLYYNNAGARSIFEKIFLVFIQTEKNIYFVYFNKYYYVVCVVKVQPSLIYCSI